MKPSRDLVPYRCTSSPTTVGLVLGAVALLVLGSVDTLGRVGKVKTGAAVVSLALGFVALLSAEASAADVLLAVFMCSILFVWAFELTDHAGLFDWHGHPGGLSHA